MASLEIILQLPLGLGLSSGSHNAPGVCMFHQVNGMIGFARNWKAQREIIGE